MKKAEHTREPDRDKPQDVELSSSTKKVHRHLGQDHSFWGPTPYISHYATSCMVLSHSSKNTSPKGDTESLFQLVSQSSESTESRAQVLHLSTAGAGSLLRGCQCPLSIYHSGTQSSLWYHTERSMLESRRRIFSLSSVCSLPSHTDSAPQVESMSGCHAILD